MEQHRKYGDLVQIAPDHVSINLPEAVADIYGHKSGCLKSDFYDSFLQVMPVVFNVRDPTAHQRKRKFLNLAFSARALSEFEPSMDVELSCWRRQLIDISKSDAVTDFTVWANYLAFDIIGRFAFGRSFGFIEKGMDPFNLITTVDTRGEVLNALGTLPAYLRYWMKYMYFDPFWSAGLRAASNLASLGRAAYFDRKDVSSPQKDLLSYLFAAKGNGDVGEQEIIAESISFIVGGSDTTSSTITHFIDFVSRDRALQEKLQEELDSAFPGMQDLDWVPNYQSLKDLPPLNAALKEVMRVRPTSSTGLERVVPKGGKRIAGVWFPAGVRLPPLPALMQH
ncbi:hypothetical protein SLS61_005559 [Didymella pomorum]